MADVKSLEADQKKERSEELKSRLVETIKKKMDKLTQWALENKISEINYAVLKEEIDDAVYALEMVVLENDDRVRAVLTSTTSGSVHDAIYKYFNGVEPPEVQLKQV